MTSITVFSYPGACSRVTMTALEEASVPYVDRWVDITNSAQYAPDYLAMNRKAKVPALKLGDTTLTENAAILHYLHKTYPDARLLPQTGDAVQDTQGLSDLVWCGGMLHPMVRQIRAPQKWTKGSDAETAGIRGDGLEKLAKECAHIDARLAQTPWWYGADWSIVDTYLYWVVSTAAKSGFPADDYPAIADHTLRVRARPAFQRMLAREIAALATNSIDVDPNSL